MTTATAQSHIVEALRCASTFGMDPFGLLATSLDALFAMDSASSEEIKGFLIADNFRWHYEHNDYYRQICLEKGVSPEDIESFADLDRIPLIPVKKFKDVDSHRLLSTSLANVEFEMRSTGTSGIPSISRRDSHTVTRAALGIYGMYRHFFRFSNGTILYLMPPTEEIPEMGMIKVLNMLAGLVDGTRTPVRRVSFRPEEAIDTLKDWENIHTRHIVGPPFMVYKLVKHLKQHDIRLRLDKGSRIITLGGWKRFTGMEIPREEFNRECAEYLGIAESQVRDMYGLVEANLLAIECEHHSKHVPPWAHFSVRDRDDLSKPVRPGRRGVLAILDPTSLSYPGFILTEDLVYLKEQELCACGRRSQQVVYLSRVKGAEIGCCAINLDRQMAGAEQHPPVAAAGACPVAL